MRKVQVSDFHSDEIHKMWPKRIWKTWYIIRECQLCILSEKQVELLWCVIMQGDRVPAGVGVWGADGCYHLLFWAEEVQLRGLCSPGPCSRQTSVHTLVFFVFVLFVFGSDDLVSNKCWRYWRSIGQKIRSSVSSAGRTATAAGKLCSTSQCPKTTRQTGKR